MGCNHMRCFQCGSHFCYLCGAWLDADNPYQHFNKQGTECFMKLWELEEGDEGDGEGRFEGARRWEAEARAIAEQADREEAEQLQREEDARMARELAADERLDAFDAPAPAMVLEEVREPIRARGAPRGAAAAAGANRRGGAAPRAQQQRQQPEPQPQQPQQVDAAAAAAFRRFVELAVRDEEDGWDSDELEGDDDEQWEIRAR